MSHTDVISFLLQIAVLLIGALLGGQVAKALRFPTVIGELVGGILLGPTVFGTLAPTTFSALFPTTGAATSGRDSLIRVGLLLFLFLAGSEVDLSHFRKYSRSVLWTSICGVAVPFGLGVCLVRFFPGLWGAVLEEPVRFSLLIGTAMSISALPVIARILKDLGLLNSAIGLIVLSAAAIDDLIGWTLFGVILTPPAGGKLGIFFALLRTVSGVLALLLVGRFVCRPIILRLRGRNVEDSVLLTVVFIFVLLAATVTKAIGMHTAVGAFLMGVVLDLRGKDMSESHDTLTSPVLGLLAPLYFVSVGLKTNFVTHFDWRLTAVITLAACLGKTIGGGFGAWRGKLPWRQALAAGFGMNARGAMEIILATVALEYELIDQRIFVSLVFMALFTSLLSAPVMSSLLKRDGAATPIKG